MPLDMRACLRSRCLAYPTRSDSRRPPMRTPTSVDEPGAIDLAVIALTCLAARHGGDQRAEPRSGERERAAGRRARSRRPAGPAARAARARCTRSRARRRRPPARSSRRGRAAHVPTPWRAPSKRDMRPPRSRRRSRRSRARRAARWRRRGRSRRVAGGVGLRQRGQADRGAGGGQQADQQRAEADGHEPAEEGRAPVDAAELLALAGADGRACARGPAPRWRRPSSRWCRFHASRAGPPRLVAPWSRRALEALEAFEHRVSLPIWVTTLVFPIATARPNAPG